MKTIVVAYRPPLYGPRSSGSTWLFKLAVRAALIAGAVSLTSQAIESIHAVQASIDAHHTHLASNH